MIDNNTHNDTKTTLDKSLVQTRHHAAGKDIQDTHIPYSLPEKLDDSHVCSAVFCAAEGSIPTKTTLHLPLVAFTCKCFARFSLLSASSTYCRWLSQQTLYQVTFKNKNMQSFEDNDTQSRERHTRRKRGLWKYLTWYFRRRIARRLQLLHCRETRSVCFLITRVIVCYTLYSILYNQQLYDTLAFFIGAWTLNAPWLGRGLRLTCSADQNPLYMRVVM